MKPLKTSKTLLRLQNAYRNYLRKQGYGIEASEDILQKEWYLVENFFLFAYFEGLKEFNNDEDAYRDYLEATYSPELLEAWYQNLERKIAKIPLKKKHQ